MNTGKRGSRHRQGQTGKWLVTGIVAGGMIVAVVASHYTKWRTTIIDPTSQPAAPFSF